MLALLVGDFVAWESPIPWSSGWVYVMFGGLLLAIIMGTWVGAVAGRKGRKTQGWFLLGFFLPFIGLIAAYIVKPLGDTGSKGKSGAGPPGEAGQKK